MSKNYSYAGQFTFDKVKIFASSGTIVDVSRLVTGLNIYEDLYKTCLTGDITLVDTNNVIKIPEPFLNILCDLINV